MTSDSRTTPFLPEIDLSREAGRLESLAALLDGDLATDRRAEILALLDAEDLDLLVEVDALADEIAEVSFGDEDEDGRAVSAGPEDAGGVGDDPPDNVVRGPWSRRAWAVGTALAAAVALAVLAPRFFLPQPPTPQSVVGAIDLEMLSTDSTPDLPWSATRGGEGAAGYTDLGALSGRDSFRLGTLSTDLEAVLRTGDQARLRTLRGSFVQVLRDSSLRSTYRDLADPELPAERLLAHHADVQGVLAGFVDLSYYRYGLWVRGAWLAADSGQLEFFGGEPVRSLDALQPPPELEEEIGVLRRRVRGLRTEDDLARLSADLERIARRHAGASTR